MAKTKQPNPFDLPLAEKRVAPRTAAIISTDYQVAVPLPTGEKFKWAFREAIDPSNMPTALASAGWSQLINSDPHYGTDSGAFGQRFGAMMINNLSQTMYTNGIFDTLYHEDPRYYRMGRGHNYIKRALYAASNVMLTRMDSGRQTINYGLLSGYAAAAATNNLYFPKGDRGVSDTVANYFNSLPGAAVGFETREFIFDALRLMHLSKDR